MKNNRIVIFLLAGILAFTGCKKSDTPIREDVWAQIEAVPAVTVKIDPTGNQSIDLTNLPGFLGKFTVAMYFPGAKTPPKVDIVVRKNGSAANVKLFQANVTTFPSAFTVTAAQIATLFGTPIVLGDTYDFGADVYTDGGSKYETFPLGSIGAASGPVNQPGYSQFARYGAICAYNPSIYQGAFSAVDAFGDANGATIVLTQIDANKFSFIYPSVLNPIPIVVTVNTATNAVSIAQQLVGTAWDPAYGYPFPNPIYASPGLAPSSGTVSPCASTVTIAMAWRTGNFGYSFGGPFVLTLTKI